MDTYRVHAKHWAHGWELHIGDLGVTQSRTLAGAQRQVRDYVALLLDVPDDSFAVDIKVTAGQRADRAVASALRLRAAADRAEALATEALRGAVAALTDAGVDSARDIAAVLRISPPCVRQLKAPQ